MRWEPRHSGPVSLANLIIGRLQYNIFELDKTVSEDVHGRLLQNGWGKTLCTKNYPIFSTIIR